MSNERTYTTTHKSDSFEIMNTLQTKIINILEIRKSIGNFDYDVDADYDTNLLTVKYKFKVPNDNTKRNKRFNQGCS